MNFQQEGVVRINNEQSVDRVTLRCCSTSCFVGIRLSVEKRTRQ